MKSMTYYPGRKELSLFASQFTSFEWELLCAHQAFLDTVICSIGRAAYLASIILRRRIHFNCLNDDLHTALATKLLERGKGRNSPLKIFPRK